ncbi:hypothetical protein [Chelatococcus sp. YT9]|uniref:DUF6931 family protein n=1 Tax=Chelatococcus sp. YT9 TaxID=2835635 RepID=UPI001BCD4EC2|nr:hypothetical protein [Chelatococcus sp. YT9]MBS7697296.1 hypothetical protein [Chelatococcus sp. YT9]
MSCIANAGLAAPAVSPALEAAAAPRAYIAQLVDAGLWSDAIRFLAFALPMREGVWWACLSARRAASGGLRSEGAERAAIAAAEAWVWAPAEEARRACLAAAEAMAYDGPAGYAALAAYWTGNLAPPDQPEIPPDARLAPTAVGAAVLLAALGRCGNEVEAHYRLAVAEALDIARGGDGRDMRALSPEYAG